MVTTDSVDKVHYDLGKRAEGKKDWVRIKPVLSLWSDKCQYIPARLCPSGRSLYRRRW